MTWKNISPDTSEEIHDKVIELYSALSPKEKLLKCSSFFSSAKRIARASILHENPEMNAIDLEMAVFRRIYKNDLCEEIMQDFERHYRNLFETKKT